MFIIGEDDRVIADPDPGRLELDLRGWVGTDANGYEWERVIILPTGVSFGKNSEVFAGPPAEFFPL